MSKARNKGWSGILADLAIPTGAIAIATALSYGVAHTLGPKSPFTPFIFLVAIMGSAARGYLPGILSCLLAVYGVPFIFNPHFNPATVDSGRVGLGLTIAVLVSAVASTRRRAEDALRLSNEDLDRRVKERTAALEAANGELARREEELNLTKAHLNDVLDSVSESFLALDRDWRFTYVNKRILSTLGVELEEVIGKVIWDLFPAAVNTEFYPQYHRVMQDRVAAQFEVEYRESSRWFEVAAHPTHEGLSAYVADITERKRDEAAIGRLASIVEFSSDAVISKDLDGTILTWNAGAERIYGFSNAEVIGKSIEILLPADRIAEEQEIQERLRRGEPVDSLETVRIRKDGTPIHVSLMVSPIRNREGQVVAASHIARDITDIKNFNAQIQQMQKLESLGVLAGGIAHDFNNLLVGILGNASLALEDAHDENRELLNEILRAGKRAADLTSQLLAYAGKGRFYIQRIDMSELVSEISGLIHTSIASSVSLHLNLGRGLPAVEGDSGQIHQVVMNLVINAAESIPESRSGDVFIGTSAILADEQSLAGTLGSQDLKPGRYILLEVRDTGCGMDAVTRSRIFDPFFTTKFTGRGLGLSAVLGIVGSHNGGLRVESEPGVGTTFRILLPATDGEAVVPRASVTSRNLAGEGMVLVVDDEELVRKVARGALERLGYSVIEAADGREAVEVFGARQWEIGAIVLDLRMPCMGGEEALTRLREIRHDIPVVLSSGFSETEALRRFEGREIAGFVQKPYTSVQLCEKVKAALDNAGAVRT